MRLRHMLLLKEEVCNRIRNQWMIYQNEDIRESYYAKEQEVKKKLQFRSPIGIVRLNSVGYIQKLV